MWSPRRRGNALDKDTRQSPRPDHERARLWRTTRWSPYQPAPPCCGTSSTSPRGRCRNSTKADATQGLRHSPTLAWHADRRALPGQPGLRPLLHIISRETCRATDRRCPPLRNDFTGPGALALFLRPPIPPRLLPDVFLFAMAGGYGGRKLHHGISGGQDRLLESLQSR